MLIFLTYKKWQGSYVHMEGKRESKTFYPNSNSTVGLFLYFTCNNTSVLANSKCVTILCLQRQPLELHLLYKNP